MILCGCFSQRAFGEEGLPPTSVSDTNRSEEYDEEEVAPRILHHTVNGEIDGSKTGVDVYKNISISLIGENLTNRHFLTKEGLHWSEKTYVELIQGRELGVINDIYSFGVENTPEKEVKAYSNEEGDSGRIHFVGRTRSDEDLDLIWTVTGSNQEEWRAHSGFSDHRVRGLGFVGEQFIPNTKGNSIVVLYNNASNLGLEYRIVKHGTMEEMPVILSFISTDIDVAQGVDTNLANIVEIIPKESGLEKKDGIIYDTTHGIVGLNGSRDLPRGGYLGAGFLSKFLYVFYSPAPERSQNSYSYPLGVRYDIFGSSLQANLSTRIKRKIRISYLDEEGKSLRKGEVFSGFQDESYVLSPVSISNYQFVYWKQDISNHHMPKIIFVYRPVSDISSALKAEQEVILPQKEDFGKQEPLFLHRNISYSNT